MIDLLLVVDAQTFSQWIGAFVDSATSCYWIGDVMYCN